LLHLLVGAAALVWVAHLMYVLDHLGRGPLGRAQPGAAPWVALAGAGVMFTSGLLPATDQPPAERPEHTPRVLTTSRTRPVPRESDGTSSTSGRTRSGSGSTCPDPDPRGRRRVANHLRYRGHDH
ncbi:MAG TPA: hypothetical protein VGG83_00405, partial [Trebonia sp.]